MRTDCKHYESRTYAAGETVRKCRLDLAPEAPWRCPAECPGYARRMTDAGWIYGSLAGGARPAPDEPAGLDPDVAAILDAAEDIVNQAGLELRAEQAAKQGKRRRRRRR